VLHKGTITYGEQLYSLVWTGMTPATSTGVGPSDRTPRLSLTALPNPASGFTSLAYSLDEAGPVTIEMYDARGRRVKSLLNGQQPAGAGSVRIDTRDLASGIYFVRMDALSQRVVHKVTIVR
jgi:hypothetical protein